MLDLIKLLTRGHKEDSWAEDSHEAAYTSVSRRRK